MKFSHGKIFRLGFGFFGVSVIWGVYNAFVRRGEAMTASASMPAVQSGLEG